MSGWYAAFRLLDVSTRIVTNIAADSRGPSNNLALQCALEASLNDGRYGLQNTRKFQRQCIDEIHIELDKQLDPHEFIELDRIILQENEAKGIFEPTNDRTPYIPLTDKYVYHPGERVQGIVTTTLSPDVSKSITNIELYFRCEVYHSCTGRVDKETLPREVETKEILLSEKIPFFLLGSSTKCGEKEGASLSGLAEGDNMLQFEYLLPEDILGTVVYEQTATSGRYAAVIFCFQVNLNLNNATSITERKLVAVQRQLFPPATSPTAVNAPIEVEVFKRTRSCKGGILSVDIKLQSGKFITEGEDAILSFYIENKTNKKLRKIKCQLFQVAEFHISNGKLQASDRFEQQICKCNVSPNIKPGVCVTIQGISLPIPLGIEPSLPDDSRWNKYVKLSYYILVEFFTSRTRSCEMSGKIENVLICSRVPGASPTRNTVSHCTENVEVVIGKKDMLLSAKQLVVDAAFKLGSSDASESEYLDRDPREPTY